MGGEVAGRLVVDNRQAGSAAGAAERLLAKADRVEEGRGRGRSGIGQSALAPARGRSGHGAGRAEAHSRTPMRKAQGGAGSDTTWKTLNDNGHRWPLVTGKAPVTLFGLQMTPQR